MITVDTFTKPLSIIGEEMEKRDNTFTYSVSDPFCVAAFWHFYDGRL